MRKPAGGRAVDPLGKVAGAARPAVLVVDQDSATREDIRRVLADRYDVHAVSGGEKALAALRNGERPHLLLTEMVMPRLDGRDLLRAVRDDPMLTDLPVILLADRDSEDVDVEKVRPAGIDYLMKPFSASELLARVAVNIEAARLRGKSRRAEETARHAQERLRVALFASRTGTFRWDFATDMIQGDAALNRLFGFSPEEATRPLDEYLHRIHPDNRQQFLDELECSKREAVDFDIEYAILRPDGSLRWVYDRGRTFRDADGRPCYMTGACVDITKRKLMEEQLQAAQMENADVTRQTALGELAASIAHEINQPLGAIVSNGDALLRWMALEPPALDEARNTAKLMVGNARRASEVIKRIRSLLAKEPPQHVALGINDAIREVLLLTRAMREKDRISLHIDLCPDLPAVLGDRVQLQQVILNLVLNGIEAMKDIPDRPRVLSIGSRLQEPDHIDVLVSVADTGTGIAPEIAERIFDPFFTTKATGMGIGLSVCRSIVEAHGGRLHASSAAPRGTRFEVSLPTADSAAS
jgi:PAS domain S-box-containing protein